MEVFPIERVKFTKAALSGIDGNASIEIYIAPFELALEEHSEQVDTSIRLDSINISVDVKELEGKKFLFPVNPLSGYIDGSIYFFSTHNPVDVTSIKFGTIKSGKMSITLETKWILEFEMTGYKNFESVVATDIKL